MNNKQAEGTSRIAAVKMRPLGNSFCQRFSISRTETFQCISTVGPTWRKSHLSSTCPCSDNVESEEREREWEPRGKSWTEQLVENGRTDGFALQNSVWNVVMFPHNSVGVAFYKHAVFPKNKLSICSTIHPSIHPCTRHRKALRLWTCDLLALRP